MRALCAFTLAAILIASNSPAQQRDIVGGTVAFNHGREAAQKGDYPTACVQFAESSRLDPKVGTLLNLADCHEHTEKYAQAMAVWQQAMNLSQATSDDRVAFARDRLEKVMPKVPRLMIRLDPKSPPATKVLRDGVEQSGVSLDSAAPVDPGQHEIVVTAPGRVKRTFTVSLAVGEKKEITVAAGDVEAATTATAGAARQPPNSPAKSESKDRTWAYVTGGIGVVGIVVAAITGGMLLANNSTIKAHCDTNNKCSNEGLDAVSSSRTLMPINTASWVVGVLGLGGGTVLYFTAPSTDTTAAHAQGLAIRVRGEF